MKIALLLNSNSDSRFDSRFIISSSQRHYIVSLTRDQRLQVHTLRIFNWNYHNITAYFRSLNINCNTHQMQYATINRIIFQKQRCEFKILLNIFTRRRMIDFIINSKRTRKMSFIQINEKFHLFVFEFVMRKVMQKKKLFRRLTRKKSFVFEKNRFLRLIFVNEHFNWIRLQWNVILWTNEIWVTNDKHTKIWISRRVDEKYEIDCIMKKKKYQFDWMFWANYNYKTHTIVVISDHKQSCISDDLSKDFCLFWKKEWEIITFDIYFARILSWVVFE